MLSDFDRGFNHRWLKHSVPQKESEKVFILKTGLKRKDIKNKIVLDAGCGCGRFLPIVRDWGASDVIGLDISPNAVESARILAPYASIALDNLLDIKSVSDESVDVAYAIGTLHHTGNTLEAFNQVAKKVKKGGQLAVWLYCQPTIDKLMPVLEFFHDITRSIESDVLYDIIKKHALKIRDVYRDTGYYALKEILRVSISEDDDECVSDTFDWHCPRYRDFVTDMQLKKWFYKSNFTVVWEGEFLVSMRGRKYVD